MKYLEYLYLLITSIIIVTFCSDTSPLYHFNPSPDPSIFFISGKSLNAGLTPYVDFADTKGILLIFLYSLAAHISSTSFLGVYIIQCLSLFSTLFFAKITADFYLSNKGSHIATLMLCIFLFDSYPYQRGGGAEEFLWPFMTALLYFLARYFSTYNIRDSKILHAYLGAFIGCSFMIKFSITIPIVILGLFLFLLNSKKNGTRLAFKSVIITLITFLLTTAPLLCYLHLIGGLQGFFHEYVLQAFSYASNGQNREWYVHLLRPIPARSISDFFMWLAIIWGLIKYKIISIRNNYLLQCTILLYILFKVETISIYIPYYNSIISPLLLIACIFFTLQIERKISLNTIKATSISAIIISILLLGAQVDIFGALNKGKYIWQDNKNSVLNSPLSYQKDKKSLYLGWLDRGYGIPLNWLPCGRYWFLQNSPSPKMRREQLEYIKQGLPDIVHTYDRDNEQLLQSHGYRLLTKKHEHYFYTKTPQH